MRQVFEEQGREYHESGFGLRIGEVTLSGPDGRTLRRSFLHTPEVVAVVAVDHRDLILVEEYRPAVGRPVRQLPMGKLTDGDDPPSAARRELLAETGFTAARLERTGTLVSCPGWTDQLLHVFLATGLTYTGRPEGQQQFHNLRLPLLRFRDAVRTGELADARTIAAVFAAAAAGLEPTLADILTE